MNQKTSLKIKDITKKSILFKRDPLNKIKERRFCSFFQFLVF